MMDEFLVGSAKVLAILYLTTGIVLVLSAGIVWLSRALKKDQWSVEP